MGDKSGIEWTDATWNPVLGCSKTSPGCDNCYAITTAHRMTAMGQKGYTPALTVKPDDGPTDWTGELRLMRDRLDQPERWQRPRRVFVNSMSDLYHVDVPDEFIAEVWQVMGRANWHQFQLLTKRSKRMRDWGQAFSTNEAMANVWPNVWLGVSVEFDRYKFRIGHLRDTPAAVRWLSIEPLVAPLTLTVEDLAGIDWVVVGGESGTGSRPMHPDWVRGLRDVSVEAGVPFFFKQWGNWAPGRDPHRSDSIGVHGAGMTAMTKDNPHNPFELGHPGWSVMRRHARKKDAGREIDGRTWDEYPREISTKETPT